LPYRALNPPDEKKMSETEKALTEFTALPVGASNCCVLRYVAPSRKVRVSV
jgi:hypothetical protein